MKRNKELTMKGAVSRIILPQLPPEIIIEILAWLPVKPLFRFKCVCKSWLNLISVNPQFAKLHLHYTKLDTTVNRYRLFLNSFPFRSIDHIGFCNGENVMTKALNCYRIASLSTFFIFIGSSNGLIALTYYSKGEYSGFNKNIIVMNPTTGDFREFPASDSSKADREIFSGIGYDSKLNDYKIVRGVASSTPGSDRIIKLEVFNFKANKWRWSQDVCWNLSLRRRYFIYTEGFLNFLVEFQKGPELEFGIVSFDLGEEKFLEVVPVPDEVTKLVGLMIRAVGDNVCVCTNSVRSRLYFEGWIMKRHYGSEISWTKLYSFKLDTPPAFEFRIDVIWVSENGNVLLDVDAVKLLLYNPKDQTFSEYDLLTSDGYDSRMTYMETLVSPNAS